MTEGTNGSAKSEEGEVSDYMDNEMKEYDDKSRQRIDIIFKEYKAEIEAYLPAGNDGKGTL